MKFKRQRMAKEFLIDEHQEEILQLEKELRELIDYDEWSSRELGVDMVDYYCTAFNLLKAGYRKVLDQNRRQINNEIRLWN